MFIALQNKCGWGNYKERVSKTIDKRRAPPTASGEMVKQTWESGKDGVGDWEENANRGAKGYPSQLTTASWAHPFTSHGWEPGTRLESNSQADFDKSPLAGHIHESNSQAGKYRFHCEPGTQTQVQAPRVELSGAHQRGGHEPGTRHRLDSEWWSPSPPHLLQVPASEADTSRAHHIDSTPGGGPRLPPPPTGATSRIVRCPLARRTRAGHTTSTRLRVVVPVSPPPPTGATSRIVSTLRIDSNEKNFVIPWTGAHQRGGHEPGTPHRLDSGWWSPSPPPHLLPPHIAGATACVPPGKFPPESVGKVEGGEQEKRWDQNGP
ncbi:hypothetical protein BJ912DRAFT_929557 [Pholiota molesta]|nr:hypothetical protein BJ912DRAFT_929557 [Pholiota molesta]